MNLVFHKCSPRPWHGFYRRVPGDTTAFHVPCDDHHHVLPYIYWDRDEGRGRCNLIESKAAYALGDAVNVIKRELVGIGGGSFLINEHGQVLVPTSDRGGNVMLAGEIEGELEFENPFEHGMTFNLADDKGLSVGDTWGRPYLGMWYNLSKYSRIYRMRSDQFGQMKEEPVRQDKKLINRLRSIRRFGPVRFIVNQDGIVLTKVPPENVSTVLCEEMWQAVYVGRIDPNYWFAKER